MKKFLFVVFILIFIVSCDDGDVIVTSFDFEDTQLQNCGGPGSYVFFKINSDSQESLSLLIGSQDSIFNTATTLNFAINGTANVLNYRTFSESPTASYFCNSIPPTSPQVLQDYIGTEGDARLVISFDSRLDNDGIEEDIESDLDTDRDLLLNYFDFDDDGDNVPTALEIGDNPDEPQDSDDDDIPDYLDEDDDNDGVLTRYEITKDDPNPRNKVTNPEVGADYLNGAITDQVVYDQFIQHTYTFSTDLDLFVSNAVFTNGEEQLTQESLDFGTIGTVFSGTTVITPAFPEE